MTRAQGGDRSAFDDLYLRYYRRLYRFCLRRLHDAHEAEDVAQEAFARAWRALPTFGGDRRFYPWLSVIASHLCTDVLRRRNRSTPVAEFHQSNVASTEDGGEELMIAAVDSDLVARAFTRLSDRHQRILNLREGSGWSYQRIADHEGVGITAVETLLWRARQALKREFASLAGAESRMAAWLGGLVSLASLRRLVGLPRHLLRKVATTGAKGSMVAAGSAVAASAVIIGATLGAPGTDQLNTNAPVFPSAAVGSGAPGAASSSGAPGDAQSGTSAGTSDSGLPGMSKLSGALPAAPSTGLSLPGSSQIQSTINSLGSTLNTTANGLTGTLGGVASSLGGATSTLGTTVDGILPGTGSLLTDPITTLLDSAGATLSDGTTGVLSGTGSTGTLSGTGTSGTASDGSTSTTSSPSSPSTALSTTTDTVTSTLQTTTSSLLGGA